MVTGQNIDFTVYTCVNLPNIVNRFRLSRYVIHAGHWPVGSTTRPILTNMFYGIIPYSVVGSECIMTTPSV